ncbi:MAG TPA: hypothetical protein VG944_19625 [Fimbriimonas sp.]|nr:hypothetical protein [Fimbriimonas sp.]
MDPVSRLGIVRYRRPVRWVVAVGLGLMGGSAWADRLIDIPTARKLPFETFRLELADSFSGRTQLGYLDLGVTDSIDASIRSEKYLDHSTVGTFDLSYNVLSAVPGLLPGIAAGVQDALNTTTDGRREYACLTWREPIDTGNGEVPIDITFGMYYRSHPFGFGGVSFPLSKEVRMIGEYNGSRPAGGFEYKPTPAFGLRLLFRGPDTLADLSWTSRF